MNPKPEHNDVHWCGRIAYTLLGLLLIIMDFKGVRAVFTEHRFAFLGCVFLVLGFMSHIILKMKRTFLKSLSAITDGIEKEMNSPNQPSQPIAGKPGSG
jgi:hypothetical protein